MVLLFGLVKGQFFLRCRRRKYLVSLNKFISQYSRDLLLARGKKCDALGQGNMLPFGVVQGFKLRKLVWYLEHEYFEPLVATVTKHTEKNLKKKHDGLKVKLARADKLTLVQKRYHPVRSFLKR